MLTGAVNLYKEGVIGVVAKHGKPNQAGGLHRAEGREETSIAKSLRAIAQREWFRGSARHRSSQDE
jgi:hypothetical protein